MIIRMIVLLIGTFFLCLFSYISCEKTTAPLNELQVTLTAPYIGFTEVDLLLQTKNTEANTQYQIFRDDSLISHGSLLQAETIIIDTLLLPAHNYVYQAFLIKEEKRITQSQEQQVTTLDTTSHDFQWESHTIESPFGSAMLSDVAIINENEIWAVGAIAADSAQPSFRYNAVHWEGAQWRLQRITVRFRDSDITPPGEGIFVFSNSDIWVTLGGAPAHWDGSNWTLYHLWDMGVLTQNDGGVTRIWGSSPDNVYFAGRGGTIVHYNGSSWQKLESGISLDIQDIWGAVDARTGNTIVLAVACNLYSGDPPAVLSITNSAVYNLPTAGLPLFISSVWSANGREWYICGYGLYKSKNLNRPWEEVVDLQLTYGESIRGNGPNDIFLVGHNGLVSHWNGNSWHTYPAMPGNYYGLAVKGDLVVAVGNVTDGFAGGSATILMGRRNRR